MSKNISRRTFLHQAALSGAAAFLAACAPDSSTNTPDLPANTPSAAVRENTATAALAASPTVSPGAGVGTSTPGCSLIEWVTPARPATTPGYTELDPATGLHMTGTVQEINLATFRLEVSGLVEHPLSLTLDELRCMPVVTTSEDLFCPGFFDDEATWAGVPIKYVLDLAGIKSSARDIRLISGDGHISYPTIKTAMDEKNFLAYMWNDKPLPVLHGFPLRGVFPGIAGDMWTKWLVRLEVE